MYDSGTHVTSLYSSLPSSTYLVISLSKLVIAFTLSLMALTCQQDKRLIIKQKELHAALSLFFRNKLSESTLKLSP